jgi:adenine-specific DNA-methyltransferase
MSIEKINQGDLLSQSADLVNDNIDKLKSLFPEIVTEGRIDFKVLQQVLGEELEEEEEYYRFTWAGKSQARREAHKPSTGTLRPAKEESLDWDTTQNMYIEGDNLEVLKLMQKSYAGKIKMIYIDPPYNTGKDFVYKDNYKDNLKNYQEVTGQIDSEGNKTSTNSDSEGRYHSNWLNMMYPRLRLARNLLKDDGVILISHDDNEDHNLRKIMDEIFGSDNYLTTLIWNKQHSQQQGVFKKYHEYVTVYVKKENSISNISGGEGIIDAGALKKISRGNPESEFTFPKGVRFEAKHGFIISEDFGDSEKVFIKSGVLESNNGFTKHPVTMSAGWTQKDQMTKYFDGEEVYDTKGQKVIEFYFSSTGKLKCRKERSKITPSSFLPNYGLVSDNSKYLKKLLGENLFDTPKPVGMIKEFINWFCEDGDIVLDFFLGSGTSCESVLRSKNEVSFIGVQLPESCSNQTDTGKNAMNLGFKNISEITKFRIQKTIDSIKSNMDDSIIKDLGFKVFKLDSSNIKSWDGNPENLETSLFDAVGNIKTDRTEEDVLYEILLKYGLDLTLPIEEKTMEGKKVFNVGLGSLFICLSDNITAKVAEGIGQWKEACSPEICRVIFKDNGFTDVEKTNSVQTLKRYGINEIRSI